jgi:hypothetical protein
MNDLIMWTVYEKPRDYPNDFVARAFAIRRGGMVPLERIIVAPTLNALRARMPFGLYRLPREPADDPIIVETWL